MSRSQRSVGLGTKQNQQTHLNDERSACSVTTNMIRQSYTYHDERNRAVDISELTTRSQNLSIAVNPLKISGYYMYQLI
jgi:hypothetical protein